MSWKDLELTGYVFDDDPHVVARDSGGGQPRSPTEYFIVARFTFQSRRGVCVLARQPAHMLALRFVFHGFDWNYRFPQQLKRVTGAAANVMVDFPPQHLAEQVFDDQHPPQAQNVPSRLSAGSRLAFKVLHKRNLRIELTQDNDGLLDWSGWAPVVDARVSSEIGIEVESQLLAAFGPGPYNALNFEQARDLVARQFATPSGDVTSLEVTNRLVFSPNEQARWILGGIDQKGPGKEQRSYALWMATLDQEGRSSVRALGSRHFPKGEIPKERPAEPPIGTPGYEVRSSVSKDAQWQISAQTSIYGLPALRRIVRDANGQWNDAPSGSVVNPPFDVGYLKEVEPPTNDPQFKNAGIAIAKPFSHAAIQLTSLGATVDAEWKGEPATLYKKPYHSTQGDAWFGFDLERLRIRQWLGRDVQIVEIYKGYLYPLGIRASYALVLERRIKTENNQPVSYLHQRRFIMTSGLPRIYPGPYHPNEAREFPVGSIRMKTLITPDLLAPTDSSGLDKEEGDDQAFWPTYRTSQGNRDVRFEWLTEDDVLVTSPLFFVRATLVDQPNRMKAMELAYNKSDNDRAYADLSGARQHYAEPLPAGETLDPVETALESYTWILKAEPSAFNPYGMDARMEGADQPPFYPRVASALVGLQSLDRLLNVSHGRYTVTFDTRYRDAGFDEAKNFRGVFLRVDGDPRLESGRQGQNMGALVKQSVQIDAISRKVGLLKDDSLFAQKSGALAIDPKGFSPSSYFDNVQLFGAIDLKQLVLTTDFDRGTPKLIETVTQGARRLLKGTEIETKDEALLRIRALAGRALVEFKPGGAARSKLTEFMDQKAFPNITIKQVYPRLCGQLEALLAPDGLQRYLEALTKATELSDVAKAARMLSLLEPLARELRALLRDPVPDLLDTLMGIVQLLQNWSRNDKDAWLRALKAVFAEAVGDWLQEAFSGRSPELTAAVFGQVLTDADLKQPMAVFGAIPRAPLRDVFSRSLQQSLEAVLITGDKLTDWLAQVPRQLNGLIEPARLEMAIALVNPHLQPLGSTQNDIRAPAHHSRLLEDLAEAVSNCILEDWKRIDSLADALQWLQKLRKQFESELADQMLPIYANLRSLLPVLLQGSQDVIHSMLVSALKTHVEARIVAAAHSILDQAIATIQHVKTLETDLLGQWRAQWDHLISAVLITVERSQAGTLLAGLCKEVEAAANGLTLRMATGLPAAASTLDKIAGEATALAGPVNTPFAPPLLEFAFEAKQLATYLLQFASAMPALDPCVDPAKALTEVERYGALRDEVSASLSRMTVHLQALVQQYPEQASVWAQDCARLTEGLLGLAVWEALRQNELSALIQALRDKNETKLADELDELCTKLDGRVRAMVNVLADPALTPDVLAETLATVRLEIITELDAKLVAHIFCIVALSPSLMGDLKHRASAFVARLASHRLNANVEPTITLPHVLLIAAFDQICTLYAEHLQAAELLTEITGKGQDDFKARRDALESERTVLISLTNISTNLDVAEWLRNAAANKKTELQQAVVFIQSIEIADLAQHLTNTYATLLKETLGKLTELIALFTPTEITTSYQWAVKLGSNNGFGMESASNTHDLSLNTTIRCNLLDQSTHLTVTGLLQPFWIELVPGFPMAKLTFDPLAFEMTDGESPRISTNIKSFKLLDGLKYLAALQSWLSGSKNGFYYEVMQDGTPGIEAGYSYDAGIIQIGNVQFINVSFHLGLKLYFNDKPAEMFFKLADRDRPFLIACPPYGGGGWLKLTSDGSKVTGMGMSLVFGGAAALGFSILRFQARVVAGVMVEKSQTMAGGYNVTAIFEAVGEGSIAGFGISVFMRLRLTQQADGSLYGDAELGFSFRIGFVKISYSVHTEYRMSSAETRALAGGADPDKFESKIEDKTTQWNEYVENFSMDLLKS